MVLRVVSRLEVAHAWRELEKFRGRLTLARVFNAMLMITDC